MFVKAKANDVTPKGRRALDADTTCDACEKATGLYPVPDYCQITLKYRGAAEGESTQAAYV